MPGIGGQIGWKKESTWGTAVTVDTFAPLVSEGFTVKQNQSRGRGIIAGGLYSRTIQNNGGNFEVGGPTTFEAYNIGQSVLWEACLGSLAAGPPIVVTPALALPSLTIQVNKPDISNTDRVFTYAGCKAATWELSGTAGEIPTFVVDWIAKSRVTNVAKAAASYSTTAVPFKMINTAITLGGVSYGVKSFKLAGDNKLSRRFLSGDQYTKEPLHDAAEEREITGEVVLEFPDLAEVTASDALDDDALEIVMSSGNTSTTLTLNVRRMDNVDPQLQGRGILTQTVPFRALATSSTMSTAVQVSIDETP